MKLLLTSVLGILLSCLSFYGHAQPSAGAPARPSADPGHTIGKTDSLRANGKSDSVHSPGKTVTDPSNTADDDFNVFLLTLGIAFASIVLGGVLVGALAASVLLLLLFGLISAGLISTGIIVGLYKKSVEAGFRTVLIAFCSLTGIMGGAICFWLINRIFHLYLTTATALLVGAVGGLLAGILLGILLAFIVRLFTEYCRRKLSLRI